MADDAGRIEALYDTDVVAWAEQQAAALRARAGGDALDYDNLAEEIDSVARYEARTCRSYIDVILQHLLKLEFAPAHLFRDNARGWRLSVRAARADLATDLSPTLRRRLPALVPERCSLSAELLAGEGLMTEAQASTVARRGGYTWGEIIDHTWWPEREGGQG